MKVAELEPLLVDRKHSIAGDVYAVCDDSYSWLPDGSVDLVLTDPPFNIARDTNFHTYEKNTVNSFRFDGDKGWDSYTPEGFRQLLRLWAKEFARVLRPGGSFAVFCADEYLSDLITAMRDAGLKPRRTLTWRKPNAVPVNRKHLMMSACEYIVVGVKGSKSAFNSTIHLAEEEKITDQEVVALADKAASVLELEIRKELSSLGHRPGTSELQLLVAKIINAHAEAVAKRSIKIYSDDGQTAELCVPNYVAFNSKAGNRLHPTEKPVQLLRYLIRLFSNPGDFVLDPFSGSASTGEAALATGRRALLVERDVEFFERGTSRIKSHFEDGLNKLL